MQVWYAILQADANLESPNFEPTQQKTLKKVYILKIKNTENKNELKTVANTMPRLRKI